jgi:hypothetical protein
MVFRGTFKFMRPASLLQVLCTEKRSVHVSAWNCSSRASIHIHEGLVVAAYCDNLTDMDALYQWLVWERGQFQLDQETSPPATVNLAVGWNEVMLGVAWRYPRRNHVTANQASPSITRQLELLLADCSALTGIALIDYDGNVLASCGIAADLQQHLLTLAGGMSLLGNGLGETQSVASYQQGRYHFLLADNEQGLLMLAIPQAEANLDHARAQLHSQMPQLTAIQKASSSTSNTLHILRHKRSAS